ncbi:SWIM zinc finger family protein [Catellatospora bangladeshensis]|uniref:SWIM zinc finger family protein n=1 Tax=Catellatospora bangladeshensis TaxID=310355 RepID=UPI003618C8B0
MGGARRARPAADLPPGARRGLPHRHRPAGRAACAGAARGHADRVRPGRAPRQRPGGLGLGAGHPDAAAVADPVAGAVPGLLRRGRGAGRAGRRRRRRRRRPDQRGAGAGAHPRRRRAGRGHRPGSGAGPLRAGAARHGGPGRLRRGRGDLLPPRDAVPRRRGEAQPAPGRGAGPGRGGRGHPHRGSRRGTRHRRGLPGAPGRGAPAGCTCPWWAKHRGDRGPCRHQLAVTLTGTPS